MSKTSSKVKNTWNAKAYDRVAVNVPKGTKERLKEHAQIKDDGSINTFINRAIAETIERDLKS